jgi:hypothetical protein
MVSVIAGDLESGRQGKLIAAKSAD